ncbi:AraC family transcriptional regulator [Clostridium sp. SM-530-WT-3G]|uniref:AraC family transcriptional regulator n=1 Tax=Clostridium sp. SM-530-WT-3G TaxID=2725303 RepID=UPI00145D9935|nr:AraC family transcriptional regulator [Clostridium sp. SM-530-WT-3G]NME82006.1 AraC family transcriptional regulator [Clostridium sp. SM-530-WT-3G]
MKFYKETVEINSLIPAKIYFGNTKGENTHYPMHWHNNIEIVFVISGEVKAKINNLEFVVHKGEILFVNSNELHETEANNKNEIEAITILLSYDFMKQYYPQIDSYYFELEGREEESKKIKELMVKCADEYKEKGEVYELKISILLMELCKILIENCKVKRDRENIVIQDEKNIQNVKRAIAYMEENYELNLCLKDIAYEIGMAPTYFERFFKKNTGETFYSYLNKIRLYYSYKELINTDLSITEIALNNGFANVKSFIELFKRTYNMTPGKYRSSLLKKDKN